VADITKEDFYRAIEGVKSYIDDKFEAHEAIEKAMLTPVIVEINEHKATLYGKDSSGGLVAAVNTIKTTSRNAKWLAGGGLGGGLIAGIANWFR